MEKKNEVSTCAYPNYQVLALKKNVLVQVPAAGDQHMKWIEPHKFQTSKGLHKVQEHYRRGDIFGGRFLTRRFFVQPNMLGKKINAIVKVVKKNHQNREYLILEIYPKEGFPQWELKTGSPNGEFLLPGERAKYIKFKKI